MEYIDLPILFQISVKTLDMMDAAIRNMKAESVSEAIDLSKMDTEPVPKSSESHI